MFELKITANSVAELLEQAAALGALAAPASHADVPLPHARTAPALDEIAPKPKRGGKRVLPITEAENAALEPEEAMHAAAEPEEQGIGVKDLPGVYETAKVGEEPTGPQPETDAAPATPASGDQGSGWAEDESQKDGAAAKTSGSDTGPTAQTDASPSEIPPEMQTFIDAVEGASTFVEVRQAMAVFFKTEAFSGLTLDQQNHIRYQTWMTLQDRKDAGDFTDLPDHATNVTAFRLWLEAQDDPEAIAGALATLERQPTFSEAAEATQAAVRKAAADRVEAVR